MPATDSRTLASLRRHRRLIDVALLTVCAGGLFALCAVVFVLVTRGQFAETTLMATMGAMLASLPVWLERKRVARLIARTSNAGLQSD